MKRIICFLLSCLMLAAIFAGCAQTNTSEKAPTESQTAVVTGKTGGETPTPETTVTDDGYEDVYIDDDDRSDVPVVKEHVMLDYLPASFTLIGTEHLPPIDDQGSIGTCASNAITYTQMTNAVSRYLHSIDEDIEWNPSSGDSKYIFAPKFTYNYSGAGTAWVYDILKDHGCALLSDCYFYTTDWGYKTGASKWGRQPQSVSWQVGEGELEKALNYRITNYDQIWMNTLDYKLTTSEGGQALLTRIKDAVVQGNVVVTGGFAYSWQFTDLTAKDVENSELAKAGDRACVWCKGTEGGHQVAVVGYDDNLECTYNGATMKGALLVANSWGQSWCNDGYFWVMYDAVNEISEFPQLNKLEGRRMAMDQFCFIYWDDDIEVGLPAAYVDVELSITDREGFYIELTRTDLTDTCVTHLPEIFNYGSNFQGFHPDYLAEGENFLTFSGIADGEAETGHITLGYNNLLPAGKTFGDYLWGVNIYATTSNVRVHKIRLYDGDGVCRAEITPNEDLVKVKTGESARYVFDFGEKLSAYHDVGSYKLKNAASGLYATPHVLMLESGESFNDAAVFEVDFDLFDRVHIIKLGGKKYVLDIEGKQVKDGATVKFNAETFTRNTQRWKLVKLEDGTYNIRLASDTRYAVGMRDGQIVLVSGSGIRDYGAWYLESAGNENMAVTARKNDEGRFVISGHIPKAMEENTLTASVYKPDGSLVKTYEATGEGDLRRFTVDADDLPAGAYLFAFTNAKGKQVSASYYAVVAK